MWGTGKSQKNPGGSESVSSVDDQDDVSGRVERKRKARGVRKGAERAWKDKGTSARPRML